tara:strand:- start:1010 stop:1309 length:300 start_codon:yes stop_codon:yes gene_type:complete
LGCRFFFDQVRTKIDIQFPNLSGGGDADPKSAIAAKETISGYGWLNSIYDLAKDGVFTLTDYNPIDSVLVTNLYEVLTYLSWKNACNRYEKVLNDLHKK